MLVSAEAVGMSATFDDVHHPCGPHCTIAARTVGVCWCVLWLPRLPLMLYTTSLWWFVGVVSPYS